MASPPRVSSVLSRITPGLTGTAEIVVGPEHTAPFVGSGRIAVLATPVGLRVTATAEVIGLEGRTIKFRVEAHDEVETIGGGTHERVVVSVERFDERVQRKVRGETSP